MDVLNVWNEGGRNGLDNGYFNFVPLAGVGVLAVNKRRKAIKSKYANAETQRLAEKFPIQDNSADQNTILQQLLAESRATLEQRNKSKGKKRAELTGKLRAYDEYIQDYQKTLTELKASEGKVSQVSSGNEINQGTPSVPSTMQLSSPTQTAPQDQVLGTASVDNQGTTKQMTTPDVTELKTMVDGATPPVSGDVVGKKDNTMLYVGIGVAVLVLLMLRKS